jgi:hypothetical protein
MAGAIDSKLRTRCLASASLLVLALALSACGSGSATAVALQPSAPLSYRATVGNDHPVAYWPMDEASGTIMRDISGNGNNGAYEGSVNFGQPGAFADGPSVGLDGVSGSARVPDGGSLQLNTVSIELWINKPSDIEYGAYVTKNFAPGSDLGGGWFQLLNHRHDGRLEFRVTADSSTVASNATLALNTWYYVVATYDGKTARLYVNGKLDNSADVLATPKQNADPLLIGRRADGLYNQTRVSQVAIYSSALSADRIAAHWRAGGAG